MKSNVFFSVGSFLVTSFFFFLLAEHEKPTSLAFEVYDGHVVFFDASSEIFYFVQYEKEMSFSEPLYFVQYDAEKGVLHLRDDSEKEFVFSVQAENNYYGIYGVGSFSGKKYLKRMRKNGKSFVLGDAFQHLPCGCIERAVAEDETADCRSGGPGAVACMHEISVRIGKKAVSVRCSEEKTYYACCSL